jgi:cell division protein ZapA
VADIELSIGGRVYALSCRDGEEQHLLGLARVVGQKADIARSASPGLTEVRQLLFAALHLADEINDLRKGAGAPPPTPPPAPVILEDEATLRAVESLADRIEAVAERLAPSLAAS